MAAARKGVLVSATPSVSCSSRRNSGLGAVGENGTASTSARLFASSQPVRAIVSGRSSFFLLVVMGVSETVGRGLQDRKSTHLNSPPPPPPPPPSPPARPPAAAPRAPPPAPPVCFFFFLLFVVGFSETVGRGR